MTTKTKRPLNLNSILHSYADQYMKLGDDEITVEKADAMMRALDGMLRVYGHALKIDEQQLRIAQAGFQIKKLVEMQPFSEIDGTSYFKQLEEEIEETKGLVE